MGQTNRQQEEKDAIRRILGGDAAAFAPLVERYQRPIFALVVRIVGQSAEAEELTQDVFMKAYRALDRFRSTSTFSTWLFRIAYNTAVSGVRRPRRELRGVDEARLANVSDDQADSLLSAEREDRVEALMRAMELLEADERALLHLFYYDAQPISSCAEILGLSEANIKVRLHRLRKKLYLLITESDEE